MITRATFAIAPENCGDWKDAQPGTVLAVGKAGPIVKCHDTALLLTRLKPEGGSVMDGGAFLRGRPLQPGEMLGA